MPIESHLAKYSLGPTPAKIPQPFDEPGIAAPFHGPSSAWMSSTSRTSQFRRRAACLKTADRNPVSSTNRRQISAAAETFMQPGRSSMPRRFESIEDILPCSKAVQGLIARFRVQPRQSIFQFFCPDDLGKGDGAILDRRTHRSWMPHQGVDSDQAERSFKMMHRLT